jgi:hypothetical protein
MEAKLERFPWATAVILFLVVVGAVDLLIDSHLSDDYQKYVDTVALIVGGLAVGRGLAANRKAVR